MTFNSIYKTKKAVYIQYTAFIQPQTNIIQNKKKINIC